MDIGKFQDAVFLTPIAGSNNPIKMLDKTIEMYSNSGMSDELVGKFMYCLALICNTYDYDMNDESCKFLRSAFDYANMEVDDV